MILIISNTNDQSTIKVIDWLSFRKAEFLLITPNDVIELVKIAINGEFVFKKDDIFYYSNDISSVWYRRGDINLIDLNIDNTTIAGDIRNALLASLNSELFTIKEFLYYSLAQKKTLNNYLYSNVNKLVVLRKAKEIGLQIPRTIITTSKKVLLEFKNDFGSLITKGSSEGSYFRSKDYWFYSYTEKLTDDMINESGESFFPSLFQKQIQKKFEVRSFYFNDKFYSMAIFSQNNLKTQCDYRKYDHSLPNRNVPFNLPMEVQRLSRKLMKTLHLDSGSIDFIYGDDDNFYFLEVNPVGQFGMVSTPCNYYIEKEIAEYLCN
ncbi:MAG: grasp-with-spasm system ATP-grasp peptide maturase [Bacteroidales bacterium]|nr:grasp-with-spasm system ATP-grasp peptide maturase [Bacteroidales bacterium]